jgi:hypothetical protein
MADTAIALSLLVGASAIAGVSVCMAAARERDVAQGVSRRVSVVGLLYCIAAGLGSGIMNVGLVAGAPLMDAAFSRGTPGNLASHQRQCCSGVRIVVKVCLHR